jgi:hypothetical protein
MEVTMSHLLYSELLEEIKGYHYSVTINNKQYWLNDKYMLGHILEDNSFQYRDTFHNGNMGNFRWWYDRIQFTMESNLQRLFPIPAEGYYEFPNSTYGITLPYVIKNFISSSPLPSVTRRYLELFGQYPNEKYYTPVQSSVIKSFNDLSSGYSASSHPYAKSFYEHIEVFEYLGKQHRYQYEDAYIYLYHEHKIPVLHSVSILNDARTIFKELLIPVDEHKKYSLQMASIAIEFVENYYHQVYARNINYGYTDCSEFYCTVKF